VFIFPDRPALTLGAGFLNGIDTELYFCTLKIDGWRCVAIRKDGVWTYTSRANKPIHLSLRLRQEFEAIFAKYDGDLYLDCELTGNRRKGDAEGIYILECLEHGSVNYRKLPALVRWQKAVELVSLWGRPHVQVVPATDENFLWFYDHHKLNTPIAEGVVLKLKLSRLIGSTTSCAGTSSWIKCKWRAGEDGLSPTEIV